MILARAHGRVSRRRVARMPALRRTSLVRPAKIRWLGQRLRPYPHPVAVELDFVRDAAQFLEVAGAFLGREPVLNTVVATVAHRTATGAEPACDGDWWLIVRRGRTIAGAGMRTAHFGPRPAFLLPMPDDAARLLAHLLHARGEALGGVNGALPAVRICAEETARLRGEAVAVAQHSRLFELGRVTEPAPVRGSLRHTTPVDLDVAVAWFDAFMADADEKAGRPVAPAQPRLQTRQAFCTGSRRKRSGCGLTTATGRCI